MKSSNVHDELARLRGQIAATKAERARAEGTSASLEEAEQTLDAWLDAQASRLPVVGVQFLDPGGALPGAGVLTAWRMTPRGGEADPLPLLAAFFRAPMREGLLAQIREAIGAQPTLSRPERERRVSVLDRKLDELEHDEEALIRRGEGEGLDVDRRADARPEIVLADEEEPPQRAA